MMWSYRLYFADAFDGTGAVSVPHGAGVNRDGGGYARVSAPVERHL